jgi:DNA mismatch repair protein MutL
MTSADTTHIHELDSTTIERIAAGEVVERPASAVKELVENSLDADADRIEVAVDAGGMERLEVADDGDGMSERDLRLAVQRHTTSKIRDVEDIEDGVGTLGFRGEALSAIGAVSKMTVTTRPRTDGGRAMELRMEGGSVVDVAPTGRGPGTTVTVTDLFYNVPARREFMKSEATEFRHVNRVVTRYALANPDTAISLTHNDRETFATPGDGERQSAVLAVYGRPVAESMIPVDGRPDGPVDRIHGLVSDPETTRSSRSYVSTYVNGRYVEEPALREAIIDAYGGQLAADRFPFAALFVSCPAETVDPNVHPRKLRVRFEEEEAVTASVTSAVREALLEDGHLRRGAPRGQSAPDETPVQEGARPTDLDAGGGGASDLADASDQPESATTREGGRRHQRGSLEENQNTSEQPAQSPESPEEKESPERLCRAELRNRDEITARSRTLAAPGRDATLGDAQRPGRLALETLPGLTILGQLEDTYLVAETGDGLILIDQHAADERVNYERLRDRVAGQPGSQSLVVPVELDLTAAEAATLSDALTDLREMGFEASLRDDRTALLTAVPTVLGETLEPTLLREVLAGVVSGDPATMVESAADAVLADLACHPSVTANTNLSSGSVVELLEALDACENPYACPHGRPTLITIDGDEIETRFERDYPGHQTRAPEDDGTA